MILIYFTSGFCGVVVDDTVSPVYLPARGAIRPPSANDTLNKL